jgi:hypothetical protein
MGLLFCTNLIRLMLIRYLCWAPASARSDGVIISRPEQTRVRKPSYVEKNARITSSTRRNAPSGRTIHMEWRHPGHISKQEDSDAWGLSIPTCSKRNSA